MRLDGREPEFSRMSLRPGLGAGAVNRVLSAMEGPLKHGRMIDAPLMLRHSAKRFPLGRYLRGLVREELYGTRKVHEVPALAAQAQATAAPLQVLRSFAWQNKRSVQSVFEEMNGPYERQLQAKERLRNETL